MEWPICLTILQVINLIFMSQTEAHLIDKILDYFSIDCMDLSKTDELNVDNSTQMYLEQKV